MLDGLHKPIRRNKDGITLHVYAWRGRGAPKLGEYKADTSAAAHAKAKADSNGIAARYAEATNRTPSAKFILGLIIFCVDAEEGCDDCTRPCPECARRKRDDQQAPVEQTLGDVLAEALAPTPPLTAEEKKS